MTIADTTQISTSVDSHGAFVQITFMSRNSQTSACIKKMVLSIFIAYALIFQGMIAAVSGSELSHKTDSSSFYNVICYNTINTIDSADEKGSKSPKTHIKHKHCALCQVDNKGSTLDTAFVFHPVTYNQAIDTNKTWHILTTHNRSIKSIYPPPIQSRGPPAKA